MSTRSREQRLYTADPWRTGENEAVGDTDTGSASPLMPALERISYWIW
jgi:hypothetical protein